MTKLEDLLMSELEQYYRILGLDTGASLEEINQAYKDLVFIWHPDRIPKDNQRLLAKATAKLQELNYAREQLRLIYDCSPNLHPQSMKQNHSHSVYRKSSHSHSQTQRPYYRDYSQANFRGANLKERDFSGRNLVQADLSYADLSDGFLHKVNLQEANLYKANLSRANLLEANLKSANLQESYLIGADLSGADLSHADLRGAKIGFGKRIMVKLTAVILTGTILPDGTIHR
jgi:uncharacterized protein YjbI with pentapeptide repeats